VLLDRFEPRKILIVDNAIRGLVMASVPLAAAAGVLTTPHIFLAAATYGLLYMVSGAGIPTMLPRLVDPDDLVTANAMESISWSIGGLAGPLLAGVAIAIIGAPAVLAVDAVSYGIFVVCLLAMGNLPRIAASAGGARGGGLGPAVGFILATPAVLAITLIYMTGNLADGIFTVFAPIYVRDVLGGDSATYGAVVSAFTGGSLVGALLVGAMGWRWPLGRSIAGAVLASGLAGSLLLLRPSVVPMIAILALVGLCASCLTAWAQTIRMRLIPPELRGRVFAVLRTLMRGTPPLGSLLAGFLLAGGDPRPAVLAMVVLNVIPGAIALVHPALGRTSTGEPGRAAAGG
jgi:MFS family permease